MRTLGTLVDIVFTGNPIRNDIIKILEQQKGTRSAPRLFGQIGAFHRSIYDDSTCRGPPRAGGHGLFAFCEHAGVDPTNNAAERALRDVVVRRKIIGQLKGGADSARRMSVFLTCVLTWRAPGRGVLEGVMRAV